MEQREQSFIIVSAGIREKEGSYPVFLKRGCKGKYKFLKDAINRPCHTGWGENIYSSNKCLSSIPGSDE